LLLTIATTHQPATDLGFLLHKNPAGRHVTQLSFGTASVVFPAASAQLCTAALLVDVDPVGLVRAGRGAGRFALAQYVNDRPYAASSFLSVAVGKVFSTALSGRSRERQELADSGVPLEIGLPVVPCRDGEPLLRRLFEPLGYQVRAQPIPLGDYFAADSRYLAVTLRITARLRDVLEHLCVLLPVLDDDKHYWAGTDEIDKLLRRGGTWLAAHPEHELITRRYLRYDRQLTSAALTRLLPDDGTDPDRGDAGGGPREACGERPEGLREQRLAAVTAALSASGAATVADLGCGSGQLMAELLKVRGLRQITGLDVSPHALELAARRLRLEEMPPRERDRVELLHGSLTYRDSRLLGFDAAAVVEVIEHLDPPRLGAFERCLLGYVRPATIVMTTPNAEYNVLFGGLPAGALRHRDHRFEWTRQQFAQWAQAAAGRHGYAVRLSGAGPLDAQLGCPTQLAVFTR